MAREDRGEYRGVYTALFDGPDYQQLGPAARLALLTIRLTTGPAAIAVVPALTAVLSVRTGMTLTPDLLNPNPEWAVPTALEELRQRGWIATEGSVVWVVRGLEFEPQFTPSNANHRKHVQTVYASLPRLAIRERFRKRYTDWFDAPSDGPPSPSEGVEDAPRSRAPAPERERAPEPVAAAAREAYAIQCVTAVNQILALALGGAFKALVSSVERETTDTWLDLGVPLPLARETLVAGARRFKSGPRSRQPHSLKYFDGAVREAFERKATPPLVDLPPAWRQEARTA